MLGDNDSFDLLWERHLQVPRVRGFAVYIAVVVDEGFEGDRWRRMSKDLLLAVNPALSVGEKENMGCVLVVPFETVCV